MTTTDNDGSRFPNRYVLPEGIAEATGAAEVGEKSAVSVHIIRRADGESVTDEYAFLTCNGPDDWTVPDEDEHLDGPVEYEILRCEVVATRTFGEPICDEDDDDEVEVEVVTLDLPLRPRPSLDLEGPDA